MASHRPERGNQPPPPRRLDRPALKWLATALSVATLVLGLGVNAHGYTDDLAKSANDDYIQSVGVLRGAVQRLADTSALGRLAPESADRVREHLGLPSVADAVAAVEEALESANSARHRANGRRELAALWADKVAKDQAAIAASDGIENAAPGHPRRAARQAFVRAESAAAAATTAHRQAVKDHLAERCAYGWDSDDIAQAVRFEANPCPNPSGSDS